MIKHHSDREQTLVRKWIRWLQTAHFFFFKPESFWYSFEILKQNLNISKWLFLLKKLLRLFLILILNVNVLLNPSCTKVFGIHTFYEERGGGGLSRPPYDLENGRLYKLQLWQAIRTIYER